MNPYFAIVVLVFAHSACADDVKEKGHSGLSPTLEPKSDKKFFGKDYPWDKRPAVDVLHFKHPYPVVQDSGDFDSDYVKDENSDDGSWKAQTEYDRLRHKLAKEKADVAKALAAKNQAEKELQDAMKKEKEVKKTTPPPKPVVQSSRGAETQSNKVKNVPAPGGIASPGDVKVATDETKRAMDALEECKKQLAEARERLKKLMKELEEAKKVQVEAQKVLDGAEGTEETKKSSKSTLDKNVKEEYQEYMDARTAYLKQQALLAKMEAEIKVAAEKVKKMRDSEDRGGGVYNDGDRKSAATSLVSPLLGFVLAAFASLAC